MARVTRLPDSENGEFPEGYSEQVLCCWRVDRDGFYLNIPGAGLATLRGHQVVEHMDGSITATPSVALLDTDGEQLAHGFLTAGEWREC